MRHLAAASWLFMRHMHRARQPFPTLARRACILLLATLLQVSAMAQDAPLAAPPGPPDACSNTATRDEVEAAFNALLKATPPVRQVRTLTQHRFLPVNAEAQVFIVEKYQPEVRHRVFVSDHGTPDKVSLLDDRRVRSEEAPPQIKGIDADSLDDKSPKVAVHFTPVGPGKWVNWKKKHVYILGCADGATPQYVTRFPTYFTTKTTCRALAILLCALFYMAAAVMSHRIHVASRKFKDATKEELALLKLNGSNYASLRQHFDPVVLTANQQGRGSATKLQIMFFSVLIFGVVSYIWMSTGNLSDLSETILYLMGISGIGATAAGATEVSRKRLDFDNWAWLINRKWLPEGGAAEVNLAQWKDVVMTNNEFDVSRFQMITFSVLVGLSLLTAGGETADLSDFTIPGTFLAILGLSQAVYVAGKLVDGPSIEQLNKQIKTLRDAETALQVALANGDTKGGMADTRGLPLDRNDLSLRVGNAYDQYIDTWETTRTMFESTLSESVSTAAKGIRPPFPFLSLPADALAAIERRFRDLDKQAGDKKIRLDVPAVDAAATNEMPEPEKTARADYDSALAGVKEALRKLTEWQAEKTVSDLPGDVEAHARTLAEREQAVRTALDQLRQRLAQLERILAP